LDQRKFISFLMLSVAVLMLFSILFPPPPRPEPAAPADVEQAADDKRGQEADVAQKGDPEGPPEAVGQQLPDGVPAADLPEMAEAEANIEKQYLTLGSLDVASGYRMLVTLTNTGATLRRAEMTSPRYTDQHDWSGYLGELELKNVDDGVLVRVVGQGTPAAKAEPVAIEPGDVIVGINEAKLAQVLTVDSVEATLAHTEPEELVTLQVRRGDNAPESRTVRLVRRPLAVLRPEIENYEMRDAELPPDFVDPPSFLLSLPQLNGQTLAGASARRLERLLEKGNWEITERDGESISFRRQLPELNLEIIKRYTLKAVPPADRDNADYPGYDLQLDVEFHNTGEDTQSLAYRLDGPTGMPLEGWWYAHKISRQRWLGGAGLRDVVVRFDGNPVTQIDGPEIAAEIVPPMGQGEALAYAGVDGQYFASVLIPKRQALGDVWFDTVEAVLAGEVVAQRPDVGVERQPILDPRTPPTFANVTCRLTRTTIDLPAGGTHSDSFTVFIGPKRPDLLAKYEAAGDPDHSLADIIYYGLALFAAVARTMLWILHFFHSIVGNYGIAIILLTVLVRGAMFPISYKQTKNMARMQALKPEMDRITEKYKTDMQKRSQAMQELYRKHQINPLGGCLPVFLQLPIFIGLYRALMVDVELRQSPLFGEGIRWCSNLAAPDMFLNWSPIMPDFIDNGMGFFGLGPYLNILPLVTVALFLVTQKMAMPEPTNEQAAMQQKMMKYMTVFIGLLFYKVASGLCLYFIASSLWGIAERKLLPKNQTLAPAADGAAGSSEKPGSKRPRIGGPKTGPNGQPSSKKTPRKTKRKK
jgi:YidC/Oxa1 family membrane protein insertase